MIAAVRAGQPIDDAIAVVLPRDARHDAALEAHVYDPYLDPADMFDPVYESDVLFALIADDRAPDLQRTRAMVDLALADEDAPLDADLRRALTTAAISAHCDVATAAAQLLGRHGVPAPHHKCSPAPAPDSRASACRAN